jgi:hypothetical protein
MIWKPAAPFFYARDQYVADMDIDNAAGKCATTNNKNATDCTDFTDF